MRHFPILALTALAVAGTALHATVQVQELTSSLASPQPIGTTIKFTALAADSNPGPLTYRFSAGLAGQLQVLRDYALANSFSFTPVQREGGYQIQVTALDPASGESNTLTINFTATSLAIGGQAAIGATPNPLVALYSAPSCPAGSYISVVFFLKGATQYQRTGWRACQSTGSNNFYIAGLYANRTYEMIHEIETGGAITAKGSKVISFQTGTPTETFKAVTDLIPPTSQADPAENIVLHSFIGTFPFATDTAGKTVWFYKTAADTGETALLTRILNRGSLLMLANGAGYANPTTVTQQILREIDLAGNTMRETNASRVAAQLVAMGTDPITAFTHDAIRLANGDTVVLGNTEKIFPAGTQGSTGPVDIIGDMIVVLDSNLQVVWYWDAFDYLDINRKAILGETCGPNQPGCPPVLLAPIANDWLHSNSLYYIPSEGNLLLSMRHQDWVVKIDYNNGAGTKNILWRLGMDGDFTINSSDPYPWFSHQHNVSFELGGTTLLTLFDNGNTRVSKPPLGLGSGHSRGQVLNLDQTNMSASLSVNDDLGVYAPALGSAQLTADGNNMFQPGTIAGTGESQTIELSPAGAQVFNQQAPTSYRSFLLPNMYSPPGN